MENRPTETPHPSHPAGISKEAPRADCANPGNPVASCADIELPKASAWFQAGSAAAQQHPMYRTSNATAYGARHTTMEFTPTSYHGRNQQFSSHLGNAGMYRNDSLNTSSDKKFPNQPST